MATFPLKETTFNLLDISNHHFEQVTPKPPLKTSCEVQEPNESFDALEDKENLNVTMKLDETFEVKSNNDAHTSENSLFLKSPLNSDLVEIYEPVEKIDLPGCDDNFEDFEEMMEVDSPVENDEFLAADSNFFEFQECLASSKDGKVVRLSLLTTFDPLYQPPINVSLFCEEIINSIVEEALLQINSDKSDSFEEQGDQTVFDMADISDKIKLSLHDDMDITILEYPSDINDKEKVSLLEEQISDVKLQLNASQQIRINLELQLRQKEEVLIKSQAEFSRKEQSFQKEIKQLKEKAENKTVENVDSQLKELQDTVKDLKTQEAKLLAEISSRRTDEVEYQKIMEEYEKKIRVQVTQLQKLREDHETVKCHLANLELAFSDLHQKYERSKKIIEGYKSNEDMLKETIAEAHESVGKCDEKYETLKAHAKAQIEKSNLEIQAVREHYDTEVTKLNAIVRRLEIKVNSLTDSLDQKTKECVALSALCDEVTGQSVIP